MKQESKLLFGVTNVTKEAKMYLDLNKENITNGMMENEVRAYEIGIENALSVIGSVLNQDISDSDEYTTIIVHSEKMQIGEEMDIEELESFYGK